MQFGAKITWQKRAVALHYGKLFGKKSHEIILSLGGKVCSRNDNYPNK